MPVKVWVVTFADRKNLQLQWIDPITGRKRTESAKTADPKKAQRKAALKEEQLNSEEPRGDGSLPFSDFVLLYREEHLQSLDWDSQHRAFGILEILNREQKPKNLRVITRQLLSRHFAWLRANGRGESTIQLHGRTIRAALQWAVDNGHAPYVPSIPRVRRSDRGDTKSKGRPLTTTEFVKMLRATKSVVGANAARSYRRFLRGLWLSGLRLGEAIALGWTPDHDLWIETQQGEFPLLGIKAQGEKGGRNRLLPLTPDFATWILRTPPERRSGKVFTLEKERYKGLINENHLSKQISAIGEAAGIRVADTGKFASAHDLRRSFGLRWALEVFPAELQQLMRHDDIKTTMTYYVAIQAQDFAARLWANFRQGNKSGNSVR